MRRTLANQTMQNWGLLNLKPMHRALLRRTAKESSNSQPSEKKLEFAWHLASWQESSQNELLDMMKRPGILIIDRDALLQRVLEDIENDQVLRAIHHRSKEQIRILWHWTLRGKQDLLWCTALSFDGLISDAKTLKPWLTACLRHGKSHEGQNNPLLTEIRLPQFVNLKATNR